MKLRNKNSDSNKRDLGRFNKSGRIPLSRGRRRKRELQKLNPEELEEYDLIYGEYLNNEEEEIDDMIEDSLKRLNKINNYNRNKRKRKC